MKIPKVISKNNNQYIFVKEYADFVLYKDLLTGVKECFSKFDLGLIQEKFSMKGFKANPQKVKI